MKILIGSDFELPIYNRRTGTFASAIGIIGGTKEEPLSIGNKCFRQEDNVGAEFNIPPVTNVSDFRKYIEYCIQQGEAIIQKENMDYVFDRISSAIFPDEELNTSKSWEFGCEPSLCAYDGQIYEPMPPSSNLRTFGFHIHISTKEDPFEVIKRMDYFLGVPSLEIDPDKDRRSIYGRAGDCRIKEYGVEYRVLGSYMLNNIEFVWEKTIEALKSKIKVKDNVREQINSGIRVTT